MNKSPRKSTRRNEHRITESNIPVIFCDGTAIYEELAKTYLRHRQGYFILAPSGSGKTYFVTHQTKKHWIDGDVLWPITGADFSDDAWDTDTSAVFEINARSDVITEQAKKLGFWVIGSSNRYLQPDAIVIPEWETHLSYVQSRESNIDTFDGGATLADMDGVKGHIAWIEKTWPSDKVPYFKSVQEAASYLEKKYQAAHQ